MEEREGEADAMADEEGESSVGEGNRTGEGEGCKEVGRGVDLSMAKGGAGEGGKRRGSGKCGGGEEGEECAREARLRVSLSYEGEARDREGAVMGTEERGDGGDWGWVAVVVRDGGESGGGGDG